MQTLTPKKAASKVKKAAKYEQPRVVTTAPATPVPSAGCPERYNWQQISCKC